MESSDWVQHANCLGMDMEVFFPLKGTTPITAYVTCLNCEVKDRCLDYSIQTNARFGVWGGVGERDRLKMLAKYNRSGLYPNTAERTQARRKANHLAKMRYWPNTRGEVIEEEGTG